MGATTGVALLEGGKGVNKWILGKIVVGWVITLIVVGMTTGLIVAQAINSPISGNPDEDGTIQANFLKDLSPNFMDQNYEWISFNGTCSLYGVNAADQVVLGN